jgi:hypothetical protein
MTFTYSLEADIYTKTGQLENSVPIYLAGFTSNKAVISKLSEEKNGETQGDFDGESSMMDEFDTYFVNLDGDKKETDDESIFEELEDINIIWVLDE